MAGAPDDRVAAWLDALERRHRERLTFPEIRRALQALSSLYVERRAKLASGEATSGAGKRAAFALYYGPTHFLLTRAIVRALFAASPPPRRVLDLGCGTGVAGAAWALECAPAPRVEGVDRSGWAVDEARWTYARLGLRGDAVKGDVGRARVPPPPSAVIAAFTVNEMDEGARTSLLATLVEGGGKGTALLVIEPLARGVSPWWPRWRDALKPLGGREDEWRFAERLPATVALLARAAGLDPQGLTGRSLFVPARVSSSSTTAANSS